mmetsp:Transcript_6872/g.11526  ORF Transcript_6872/g.11526 Transcript_6872/m.11526 type:complete len:112 (-) Transcript_6872:371-706(-)
MARALRLPLSPSPSPSHTRAHAPTLHAPTRARARALARGPYTQPPTPPSNLAAGESKGKAGPRVPLQRPMPRCSGGEGGGIHAETVVGSSSEPAARPVQLLTAAGGCCPAR